MRIDLSNLRGINRSDQSKIDKLKQGDVIRARVIESKGDTIKLDLGSGEIIEGKLDVPLDFAKGRPLKFVVKDLKEGTLVMSPVYEEVDTGSDFVIKNKNAIMDRILNLNNLSKEDKNLSIIKNMVSYKMPLKQKDILAISKYTDKLLSLLSLSEGETLEFLLGSDTSPLDIDINKLIKVSKDGQTSETIELNSKEVKVNENSEKADTQELKVESNKLEKNNLFKEASLEFLKKVQMTSTSKETSQVILKNVDLVTTSGETKVMDTKSLTDALKTLISTSQFEDIDLQTSIKNIEVFTTDGEKITLNSVETKSLTDSIKTLLEASQLGDMDASENLLLREIIRKMNTENINKTDFKDVTELIKNEMKLSFDNEHNMSDIIQKLTFLVKSDVDVTISNLTRLNKFLEQNKTINNDLIDILELATKEGVLDEKSKLELMAKIKTLDLKFDGTDADKLKSFQSELREVSEKLLSNIKSSQKSSEELNLKTNNLNDDIDFLNKINNKNTLMLIPFTMNQKELENSLYVLSKRKTSKDSENIKIYMNLNTNNLDCVKILCDYSQDKLNINFKVKEDYVKLFETRKVELQSLLESKGYENTLLHVNKQQEEKILDIISHDDTINYMLNIKV